MKYIKLFEQADWDDPFGEEFDINRYNGLKFYKWGKDADYYIGELISNEIHYFENYTATCKLEEGWSMHEKYDIDPESVILIYDRRDVYELDDECDNKLWDVASFKRFRYKNLPQEIKNKLA